MLVYFEILDKLIGEIDHRFDSLAFILYSKMEDILENGFVGDTIPKSRSDVIGHFNDDLIKEELQVELSVLKNYNGRRLFNLYFKKKN